MGQTQVAWTKDDLICTDLIVTQFVENASQPVESEAQAGWASERWNALDEAVKEIEGKYKRIAQLLNEGLRELRAAKDSAMHPLEQAKAHYQARILAWRRQEKARVEKEEEEYQKQVAAAEATNKPPEDVPVPIIQPPAKGFETTNGRTVMARKVPKWRVVDVALIPWLHDGKELWRLNDGVVTEARRKAGDGPSPIKGIEFYYEETLAGRG